MGANVFLKDATLEMDPWKKGRHWSFDSQSFLWVTAPAKGGCGELQPSVASSQTGYFESHEVTNSDTVCSGDWREEVGAGRGD